MRKRRIVFTTGIRSDYYIQKNVIKAVENNPNLESNLIVTGAHLSKKFGYTIDEIYKNKHNVVAKINNLIISDKISSRVLGASIQLNKLIRVFEKIDPDILKSSE